MIHSTGCQHEAWVIQLSLFSFAVRIKISVRFDENGEEKISFSIILKGFLQKNNADAGGQRRR